MTKRKNSIVDTIADTVPLEKLVDWHTMSDEDIAALAALQVTEEEIVNRNQQLLSKLLHTQSGKLWQALMDTGELLVQVPAHEVRTLKQRIINTKQRYNALLKRMHRLDEQERRMLEFVVNYVASGNSEVTLLLVSTRSGQPLDIQIIDSNPSEV
jgi:hypothetical protein